MGLFQVQKDLLLNFVNFTHNFGFMEMGNNNRDETD